MSLPSILAEGFKKLPVLTSPETCSGKTYIVTGANTGLGLEIARHLARSSASRVIITVRNMAAGAKAKADIEQSTGRKNVVDVWHLDLASVESINAFAAKASAELDRLDAVVANAGLSVDKWQTVDGMELTMTVNVINTMLHALLMLPKLKESARKFGVPTRLVFTGSALGFVTEKELRKGGQTNVFQGFNDPKRASLLDRYALSKLVQIFAFREFAAQYPVDRTDVIINLVGPGLCKTGLGHENGVVARVAVAILRALFGRSAEEGSRTIVHGVVADQDTHGKFLSGCEIKEYWVPKWMTDESGVRLQKQIWKELVDMMEKSHPGCTTEL